MRSEFFFSLPCRMGRAYVPNFQIYFLKLYRSAYHSMVQIVSREPYMPMYFVHVHMYMALASSVLFLMAAQSSRPSGMLGGVGHPQARQICSSAPPGFVRFQHQPCSTDPPRSRTGSLIRLTFRRWPPRSDFCGDAPARHMPTVQISGCV